MATKFECGEMVRGPDCEGKVICVGSNVAAVEWRFASVVEKNLNRFDIVTRFGDGDKLTVLKGKAGSGFHAGMTYTRHLDEQDVDITGRIVCGAGNYALVDWSIFNVEKYNLRRKDIVFNTGCIGVIVL